ncbi:hypothetical protein M8C21_025035, partial [Ambrosia artemisiifolia]
MGQKKNSSFQSPDYFHRLSKALQFAVSEWLLMFLLFIDACFTYLIAKFASYCQLQGPCVLCSRYDHVLAKDKTGIYWDSICNHHKSEISSLVMSHVNGICENCLAKNRFSDETSRLLVGKMGSGRLQNHDSSGSRICFCCNEQCVSRDDVKNLLPNDLIHSHASESLITDDEHAKNEKNIFVDESLESCKSIHIEKNMTAHSSEFEYQKDDVNSGNELELPVYDIVPEVHLKSDSHFEFSDAHNDCATVATREIDEVKRQDDEIEEDITRINEPLSFDDVSPSNNDKSPADDFLETSLQFLQSRISLERNESNISLDGSVVSEIEGEGVVDRLRRQVEHDKKLMGILYKELEEERNASAVATNQAMAMITRLQEEKAALYTEALQSLRMMEEQAEYDNEALQKANDIIEEKDKQIQELEELVRKTSE